MAANMVKHLNFYYEFRFKPLKLSQFEYTSLKLFV